MSYAQQDYTQLQGNDGIYAISEIGSLVTAFCNLEAGFGYDISPPDLDNWFKANTTYVAVDDEIRDDLAWGSITVADKNTTVNQTLDRGTNQSAGWPTNDQSIVRFHRTIETGQTGFHFCKVADAANRIIIDSLDGERKTSPYGEPTAWAEYSYSPPVSASPVPLPVSTPIESQPSNFPDGAMTADSPVYPPIVRLLRGYNSPGAAATHDLKYRGHDVQPGENYFLFTTKYGMDNVTLISGQPGAWINPSENVLPAPEPEVLPIEVSTDWTDPRTGGEPDWRTTYVPLNKPERCVAMHDIAVIDLEGIHRNARMRQYDVTPIAGQFIKDDILYGRPESAIIDPNTGIERRWWYGIPMSQLELESAVYNSATDTADRQVTKTLTIHDYFVLLIAKIESKLSKKDKK